MVCGTGFRQIDSYEWDYWCVIPVRMIMPCRATAIDHTKSRAGSNQMDPFHYIHLSGAKADIRGSYIGLYTRHNFRTRETTVISINLLDRRLRDLIEEPLNRVCEAVRRRSGGETTISPYFILVVYLSSALRWWNNVLFCFNQQLVMHVRPYTYYGCQSRDTLTLPGTTGKRATERNSRGNLSILQQE